LACNDAISAGLDSFRTNSQAAQDQITKKVQALNALVEALTAYSLTESDWFAADRLTQLDGLRAATRVVDQKLNSLTLLLEASDPTITNLTGLYTNLEQQAINSSTRAFDNIASGLPDEFRTKGIIHEVFNRLQRFADEAGAVVHGNYVQHLAQLGPLDLNYVAPWAANGEPVFRLRWKLYDDAWKLASSQSKVLESDLGNNWIAFTNSKAVNESFRRDLNAYEQKKGPYASLVTGVCGRIAGKAESEFREQYVDSYVSIAKNKLASLATDIWDFKDVTNAIPWFARIESDLNCGQRFGVPLDKLEQVRSALSDARSVTVKNYASGAQQSLKSAQRFPIVLDADPGTALSRDDLVSLKGDLDRLESELRDPVWSSLPESAVLGQVRKNPYTPVLKAFVDESGRKLAEARLSFIPPKDSENEKQPIIRIFTAADIVSGGLTNLWDHLPNYFGQAYPRSETNEVDRGLTISFRREASRPVEQSYQYKDWALPRMVRDGKLMAERLDNGARWRFKLALKDSESKTSGFAVFEIYLRQPLPEEWSKIQ
jgi:hypothetical protein